MAQRVLGIDLGSHSVKVAEVEVGFKVARLVSLKTIAVPPGTGPTLERSLEALRTMSRPAGAVDGIVTAVPGDRVLLRLLDIPITDAKRLGAVVGNELADDLPWEMEDVVFDHASLGGRGGKLLAVAARSAEVRAILGQLGELGLEPRALPVASLGYGGVARKAAPAGVVLIADLGHQRTNLCLVQDGRPLLGRTISRGGHQLTEAIRRTLQLGYAEAEELKQTVHLGAASPAAPGELGAVVAEALAPLTRELQLTMGLFSGQLGVRPERVLLCGGTSQLGGLEEHLATALGLPVERLRLGGGSDLEVELGAAGEAVGALALSLALEHGTRHRLDLRQGEFAYRADTSILKDKVITIAVSVVLVLLFAALNAYMSLRALRDEDQQLAQQLKRSTQMVFGEAVANPKEVSRRVKLGSRATSSGIPQRTAFDILTYLSTEVPGADKVKLDITRLEIKPGKTYLTGTADSRSAVGDVVKELQKNKCFSNIATGTISDVADGKKQFSLTITTDCF